MPSYINSMVTLERQVSTISNPDSVPVLAHNIMSGSSLTDRTLGPGRWWVVGCGGAPKGRMPHGGTLVVCYTIVGERKVAVLSGHGLHWNCENMEDHVESWSCEIGSLNRRIALKFGRRLGSNATRASSQYNDGFSRYGISIIKTRGSQDCPSFIMGIHIVVRWYFHIETPLGPFILGHNNVLYNDISNFSFIQIWRY